MANQIANALNKLAVAGKEIKTAAANVQAVTQKPPVPAPAAATAAAPSFVGGMTNIGGIAVKNAYLTIAALVLLAVIVWKFLKK